MKQRAEVDDPIALVQQTTSLARSASTGMAWIAIAAVFSKTLSFFSQIVLGYALSIETYALFGVATTCLYLIAGFKSPSVSKALIQNADRFEELFPTYSAFAFLFGLLGGIALVLIAAMFQQLYGIPNLFAVLCVTSVAVPFLASNTTLKAGLSKELRFRDLNVIEIQRSLIYYSVLICAALYGAEDFTMAIALVVATLAAHVILRVRNIVRPRYLVLDFKSFLKILVTLRWVLLTAFLTALAIRSDYLVLGLMLSVEQIGLYSFGFMLMMSLVSPVDVGITQVFLPVFARLKGHIDQLRKEVLRFSSAIIILGCAICIVILGLGSIFLHLMWNGKWDGAQFVICLLAVVMPFRFLATTSATGLEALGCWRLRNGLLFFESLTLAGCAAFGAAVGGMEGAIIGVIGQRILCALMTFAFLAGKIELPVRRTALFLLRLYVPFLASAVLLFVLSPVRHGGSSEIAALELALIETLGALLVFGCISYWWNRTFFNKTAHQILNRVKRC